MRILAYVASGIFVLAFGAFTFLVGTGDFHVYRVPTEAMMPTLSPGDHFFADAVQYRLRPPQRGEILVFTTSGILGIPKSESEEAPIFVKRLVALPGDMLAARYGALFVNGKEVSKARGFYPPEQSTAKVPENSYFVVGDNVDHSYDSRYWGFLPAKNVKGRAVFRYWPLSRIGPL